MKELFLCSFSSSDLKRSINRYLLQAKEMNIYNKIKVYKEDDLPKNITKQINDFFTLNQKRLYGYACWKAFVIKDFLKSVPKNSIVQYSDIGCHFNINGKERLYEYIEICKKKNILGFQYYKPDLNFNQNFSYQNYIEKNFTKKKLLEYLKVENNESFLNSTQFWSGTVFFKNNEFSLNFLSQWERLSSISYLIDDSLFDEKNDARFVEHRHDQSIFSLLCKINNIKGLSASECEWAETDNKRTWEHLKNFPILAKRNKKYNILRRFISRQKKNISRLINRLK
jgi:hypothetical protein